MPNCLIIENNKKIVNKIKSFSSIYSEFSFLNISEKIDSALDVILKYNYDVIFFNLDSKTINIPEFFFEIQNSNKLKITFIALSSKKESAFVAYKYGFSDFVLKPITDLTIRKCLLKYKKKEQQSKRLCLKSNKDYRYLQIDDIIFLKADNNTTDFHMSDGTIITAYKTLKTFEISLPNNFIRIHKSYIINSNNISRIHYGKSICSLSNNQYKLPFTKTFLNNINFINDLYYRNVVASN